MTSPDLKTAILTTIMAHLENWTEGAKFRPQCEQMVDAVMEQIEQSDTIATLTAERDRLREVAVYARAELSNYTRYVYGGKNRVVVDCIAELDAAIMPRDWGDDVQPGKCVLLEEAKPAVVLDGGLVAALEVATKWMAWWLSNEECECEAAHYCGKPQRQAELDMCLAIIAKAGNGGRA